MENFLYQFYDSKVILRIQRVVCDNSDELFKSGLFTEVLERCILELSHQNSRLLRIFPDENNVTKSDRDRLTHAFLFLAKLPAEQAIKLTKNSESFFRDLNLLSDFVEYLYNFWRNLHRLLVCDSTNDRLDKRPYRTFNDSAEKLMHVVRLTYRDVQENITGKSPRIYRQVSAGAEIGAIALPTKIPFPASEYEKLNKILMTRQVLIYPPMIFNSTMNKRSGMFERVDYNPIKDLELDPNEWLCYPAKVGSLVILIYFSMRYFELGFSLSNLFEMADNEDLKQKPDAIFLFGVPPVGEKNPAVNETIFYDDEENDILIGTIPYRKEYGYFGYLKKMTLTLHNIKMMKMGRMPYHGAMFRLVLRGNGFATILVMGDSGAGKSETLEALRAIVKDEIEELIIVADDMGSLGMDEQGNIIGYGTEMGAFVRLDDLQSGYAFGQIDRTIIMNPDQVNARVVLPVTKYEEVIRGYPVDMVLYANNYEEIDAEHPVIESFSSAEEALSVFRAGAVMSKGTTTTTGLVNSFYANIFGPPQYPETQERIAQEYFRNFYSKGLFVGQMRTQLGVSGKEHEGPQIAAQALLTLIKTIHQNHQ
jgi:hypothetical protein